MTNSRKDTTVFLGLAVGIIIAFGVLIWNLRWMSDDGMINVRIIQNLLSGHGPVFNIGERVEAYTSPLWIGLVSVLTATGVRAEWAAVLMGLVTSVSGLSLALLGAIRLRAGGGSIRDAMTRKWMVPAGAATYVAIPVVWEYGTSGLENGLSLAWLGGTFCAVAYQSTQREPSTHADRTISPVAILIGLGPLVRPELALYSAAFILPSIIQIIRSRGGFHPAVKRLATQFASMAAIPVAYEVWRMGYFAALVPNTAIAKSAFEARWTQGWYFFDNFFGFYLLILPLSVLALELVVTTRRIRSDANPARLATFVLPALAGIFHVFYIVRLGGGFMHGRLFLPALFALLLPVSVVSLRGEGRIETTLRGVGFSVLIGWAVICSFTFRIPKENQHYIGDERGWYTRQANQANPVTVEDYSQMHFTNDAMGPRKFAEKRCPDVFNEGAVLDSSSCEPFVFVDRKAGGRPRPIRKSYPLKAEIASRGTAMTVLRTAIGIKSMVLGPRVHVVDRAGLASPIASRLTVEHRGRPGHERSLNNAWYIGRFAAPAEVPSAKVSAAHSALQCGLLGELNAAVTEPLSLSRFLENIKRAYALHNVKIPADPFEGLRKFCGKKVLSEQMEGGEGGDHRRWVCPRGYRLAGLEGAISEKRNVLANVRPLCGNQSPEATADAPRSLWGPRFGGNTQTEPQRHVCEPGRTIQSLQVASESFVTGIELTCSSPTEHAESSPRIGSVTRGRLLSCPDGAYPAGIAVQSGALIDAVGIVCRSESTN